MNYLFIFNIDYAQYEYIIYILIDTHDTRCPLDLYWRVPVESHVSVFVGLPVKVLRLHQLFVLLDDGGFTAEDLHATELSPVIGVIIHVVGDGNGSKVNLKFRVSF